MNLDYKFFILTIILGILYYVKFPIIEKFEENIFQNQLNQKLQDPSFKLKYDKIEKEKLEEKIKDEQEEIYKKIYYDIPMENNNFDKSVLKNYRYNKDYHTYSQEINFTNVHEIISKIKPDKYYILDTNFGEHFVKIFNQLFFQLNMNHIHHKNDNRKYEINDFRILINQKIIKSIFKIVYEIKIHKKDKHYGFVFQNTLKYNLDNNLLNYLNIELVGILNEEDIIFKNKNNKNYFCKFDTNKNKDDCFDLTFENKNSTQYDFLSGDFLNPFLKKFYDFKKKEEKTHDDYKKFKCFYNIGNTYSQCVSYNKDKQRHGIWDKPCNNNEDCPFYKKNKNYENEKGGCVKGYCEMPLNTERQGYRFYKNEPYCYNCNIKNCKGESCYNCCDEQKNRNKYPNLKSPDYIFKNDNRD